MSGGRVGPNPAFTPRVTNHYFGRRCNFKHVLDLMPSRRNKAVEAENATIPVNVRYQELLPIMRILTGNLEVGTDRTDRESNARAVVFIGISPSANKGMPGLQRHYFGHGEV